jgi:hypothetical protein
MIWSTRVHTIQNAKIAGLALCGVDDEYGTPQWIGTKEMFATFKFLESDENLL